MKTHIIIVNYRTAELTLQAVASVVPQRQALQGGRVIVIDNASGDNSVPLLQQAVQQRGWGDWVEIFAQERNGGFSFGNNRGFDRVRALGDFGQAHMLLLNPDATLQPGCLRAALTAFDAYPKVGIIGAPVLDGAGARESSAHRWPSPLSELVSQAKLAQVTRLFPQHDVSPEWPEGSFTCDWVSGAFFLIRAELAARAGDMDERYFLYFEEVDYCRRAAQLGWTTLLADGPGIVHLEGASTGIGERNRPRADYWYDSRRRYFKKYHGVSGLLAADCLSVLGRALYLPRHWLKLGSAARADLQPRGYHRRMLLSDLKGLFDDR